METNRTPVIQMSIFETAREYSPKKPTHKNRLLRLFEDRSWHSNIEMNQICFNYKGRIYDLKQEGWLFEKRHDGGSEWAWRLFGHI